MLNFAHILHLSKIVSVICKSESVCSLFPETDHISQQISTKFGMRHPSILRMVMGMEFYL